MSNFNFLPAPPTEVMMAERMLGSSYLPKSVDYRSSSPVNIGKLTITSTVTIPNNTITTFSTAVVPIPFNPVLLAMDHAIFVGSPTDPVANLLPGGTAVNMGGWRIFGPLEYKHDSADQIAGTAVHITRTGVTNLTGSSQTVTLVRTYKYLINDGGEV